MNISKITHLAVLTELHIENEASARYWTQTRNLCKWIFIIAEKHCPALKKSSLMSGLDVTQTSNCDEDHEQDKSSILYDIDDDFYKLDFRDDRHKDSRVVDAEGRSHLDELFDRDYCRYTSRKLHKASTVLREYLNDYKDNEAEACYWKKVKVVPALRAWVTSMAGNT